MCKVVECRKGIGPETWTTFSPCCREPRVPWSRLGGWNVRTSEEIVWLNHPGHVCITVSEDAWNCGLFRWWRENWPECLALPQARCLLGRPRSLPGPWTATLLPELFKDPKSCLGSDGSSWTLPPGRKIHLRVDMVLRTLNSCYYMMHNNLQTPQVLESSNGILGIWSNQDLISPGSPRPEFRC